jgi:hypothetical protein
MAKGNHKKTYTPEDISSKSSVLEDQLIGGLDDKYHDSVQKLIDIGKEKGYLLYDEVSDLLPAEISASAEDLDDLFSAFATAGIEVIATDDQNFGALDKIPGEKKFDTEASEEGIELRHPSRSRRLRAFLADVHTDRENVGWVVGDGAINQREENDSKPSGRH